MGLLSKEAPGVKPRDEARALAAGRHVDPIRDELAALGAAIRGRVMLAPKEGPGSPPGDGDGDGGEDAASSEAEAYHRQRERPFYFSDANYPGAIVLAEDADDVKKTMEFIQSLPKDDRSKYPLCIAGGCHSHYCMVEKSIVIDLEKMNMVKVDVDAKTIKIQGGAKIKDAHLALRGTGLGLATGTNEDTGISGLTLAGGAGWLGGRAGYACDTVVEAEVVLPSGQIVTATDDNDYADLLRALRGGGGNFGLVTQWTFRLFDVSDALGGTVVHFAPTLWRVKRVLENYARDVVSEIPDAGATICAMPGGAPVFITVSTMIGDEVKDAKTFADVPFLHRVYNLGAWFRMSNDMGRKDYLDGIAPMLEPVQQRSFASNFGVIAYSFDEAIRDALVHFTRVDLPAKNTKPVIIVQFLSGEMRRNDGSRSSLRHRKGQAWIIIEAGYEPHATEEQIESVLEWARRAKAKFLEIGGEDGPHNFRDTDGRRIGYFTEEQRAFLEGAKLKYDPDNVLTLNKNIIATQTE